MSEIAKGFYYHYKHNPERGINNYAYEVLNVAHHTEMEDFTAAAMVIYRPLYEAKVYTVGKHWDARPLVMFVEKVTIKNEQGESLLKDRFTKINDPKVISELKKIRDAMYIENIENSEAKRET